MAQSTDVGVRHENNFGFLRVLFASMVIVTHSCELVDGTDHRDPIRRLIGLTNLSYLAVDGFFLLSGYLIVQSWSREPVLTRFLRKRALRIYPGFVAATLFSGLVVAPLGGNPDYWREFDLAGFLGQMATLGLPRLPSTFELNKFPIVNGSMWTIRYEFICYLGMAALQTSGLFKRLWAVAALLAACLAFFAWDARGGFQHLSACPGPMGLSTLFLTRFSIFFMAGWCFFLFRDRIRYGPGGVLVAVLLMIAASRRPTMWLLAEPIGGGYLVFAFAFVNSRLLRRVGDKIDISYGLYLYAFPIQTLIVSRFPAVAPAVLAPITVALASAIGVLSWYAVERPALGRRASAPAR